MKNFKNISLIILILFLLTTLYQYQNYLQTEMLFSSVFIIALLLAIVIRSYEKKEFSKKLKHSHEAALHNMILMVSTSDKETGSHLTRTKHYAQNIAQYLYRNKMYPDTVTPLFIEHLFQTTPLHDIGKIGIPDNILKKPGKLTSAEYEIIQTHSLLGKNIVDQAKKLCNNNLLLDMAHDVIYYHHERWDGKGYPSKLKGEEIPLSAQIMTICDVYDALVTQRCYKKAYSYDKADAIILEGKGTIFNPILVEVFQEVLPSFHSIADHWKE